MFWLHGVICQERMQMSHLEVFPLSESSLQNSSYHLAVQHDWQD